MEVTSPFKQLSLIDYCCLLYKFALAITFLDLSTGYKRLSCSIGSVLIFAQTLEERDKSN